MAEVTLARSTRYNVAGSRRSQTYYVTGSSGDTLTTQLGVIDSVLAQPSVITAATVSGGTVTITSSSGFTAVPIQVQGA